MKLMYNKASPFVRKVNIVLHLLGLTDRVEYMNVAALPSDPEDEIVASNPLAKIPTLVYGFGKVHLRQSSHLPLSLTASLTESFTPTLPRFGTRSSWRQPPKE